MMPAGIGVGVGVGVGRGVPLHCLVYTSIAVQTSGEQQGVELQLPPTASTHEGVEVGVGVGVGFRKIV